MFGLANSAICILRPETGQIAYISKQLAVIMQSVIRHAAFVSVLTFPALYERRIMSIMNKHICSRALH